MGFSVYIHLPYCRQKCPYCDFNTYAVTSFPESRYAAALERELDSAADDPAWSGRKVSTVFFGGGTPSLFEPATLGALLEAIERKFGFTEQPEITMEANPGTLEGAAEDKLAAFRAAGINRLSLGAQTFNAAHLATLGRLHSADDTLTAFEAARHVGIDNISCDLIFAVPEQTLTELDEDLDRMIDLAPEHVSAYNLTYEKGTPMTGLAEAGRIRPLDEDLEYALYERTIDRLGAAGYAHYEISNFARPGRQARHNLAYWTWRDYLGLGAGAHGFARRGGVSEAWGIRYANARLPETYMSATAGGWSHSRELLDRETAISEFVMLGLRLLEGFPVTGFEGIFGCSFDESVPGYEFLASTGFVERHDERIRLTPKGLMLADSVIGRITEGAG